MYLLYWWSLVADTDFLRQVAAIFSYPPVPAKADILQTAALKTSFYFKISKMVKII